MTTRQLRQLLEHVEDTREIVLRDNGRGGAVGERDELAAVWSAARAEANLAYAGWCETGGAEAYAVYRAAEDRADSAEMAFAAASPARLQGSAPSLTADPSTVGPGTPIS